jgi:hypothetical protein
MVTAIITVFLDTISALFAGIGEGIVTVFQTLIYDSVTGLTELAEWMLIFMGVSFALTIFYALLSKVL